MTEAALLLSICAVAMALVALARSGGGRSRSDALTEVRLSRIERRLQETASYVGLPSEAVPPPRSVVAGASGGSASGGSAAASSALAGGLS